MSTGAKRKKPAYDPAKQWGLKPEDHDGGGNATYVVSGHIISGSSDAKALFISETLGRDAQAKASRVTTKGADEALQKLLQKDKQGTKALVSARAHGKRMAKAEKGKDVKDKKQSKHSLGGKPDLDSDSDSRSEGESEPSKKPCKSAYSAHLIKQLGFDPTAKDGRKSADSNVQSKLDALAALQSSRRDIRLGPRPGKRSTCVQRPESAKGPAQTNTVGAKDQSQFPLHFLDSDDENELDKGELPRSGNTIEAPQQSNAAAVYRNLNQGSSL